MFNLMNLTTVVNEFYSEGFFGYGEKGNFKYWSFAHFAPIVLLIVAIVLTYIYRDKIKNWKHERDFRFAYAFITLMVEMSFFWRLTYVGSGDPEVHNMVSKFPVQVCQWTCIFSAFMLMKESKTFFHIDSFVSLTIGFVPLLTPAVILTTGPAYYRYYQFWGEHILPIYAVFYMMFIHDFKLEPKKIYKPICFLAVLVVISLYLNNKYQADNVNYLYLAAKTDGDSIANILPSNMYLKLLIYTGLISTMFGIEIGIFALVKKLKKAQ